ncbi:protein piccolo isoform X2 [Xyrichtys novacula]|uniref:Protein piccolo isoform X2 n=1 Tax=Xyrichtys novacula TaxID=13765 RepID=A0AAV1HLJ7_XYRNO|nr:protein piccolo isoform X2 [Xyrichtys novacula]
MRGDTATENEVDENGEEAAAGADSATGERRPSIVTLQNMLKKVSHSPFQNQYKTLVSSNSESSGSSANESVNKQNEVNGGLTRNNPFYSYYLESGGSKGHIKEDTGGTSKEKNLDAVFLPPPEFQSSPLDHQTQRQTVANAAGFSEPQKSNGSTQLASTNGHSHDSRLNSADLFKPTSTMFKNKEVNLQAATGHDTANGMGDFSDKSPGLFDNPFNSSPNNKDTIQSTQPTMANPFYSATTSEVDLFQPASTKTQELMNQKSSEKIEDVFSPSSAFAVDPFPSPITRNLFQDTSSLDDPFGSTPFKQNDPFQDLSKGTPDIFKPLPPKRVGKDGLSDTKMDMLSTPDLFKPMPSDQALDSDSADKPRDILLTTPGGTEHDILQPSPFSRARNLSMSPSQSQAQMAHVQTFKRPPKPLPRTKPLKTEKSPGPEKPPRPEKPPALTKPETPVPKTSPKLSFKGLPKPVIRRKPKTPENKSVEPDNYVVFEDILLIGQEKCVEDWPEDSPELNPDFKPSGALRLRRESYKLKVESDGGSGEDQDGSGFQGKKKERKHRMSILSRRGSKDKYPDDTVEGKSRTLPVSRRSSKDYLAEGKMSAEDYEDGEENWVDYKKRQVKTKVNHLLRRASTNSSVPDGKRMNGFVPQESKDDKKSVSKKNSIIRRWSDGTVLDGSTGEEEEDGGEAQHGEKKKRRMKIKFVPHRGFAITVEKKDELQGAHGYTPRKSSKDKSYDEALGAYGYTPRKKSQADAFENVEELKSQSLQSSCKADYMEDEELQKGLQLSADLNGDEDPYGQEDVKPKKSTKMKLLHANRRSSKEDMLDDVQFQKKKSSFSAEGLDDEELYEFEKPKKTKRKAPIPIPHKPKTANGQSETNGFSQHVPEQAAKDAFNDYDDDVEETGNEFLNPLEMYPEDQDDPDICKPKKSSKLKALKKRITKRKSVNLEHEDPPGAASGSLSEAAKAEWLAAQMDEQTEAGLEDEDEEGDTDSLMEWWNTVEQWDEVPSDDEEKVLQEDESKSFSILADKVHRGLQVYNKVFTERAEVLWQSIIRLHAIADDISSFHHKAKIAGITGGTTTAVGGVAAIAGLALVPVTFGASLVITAIGVGVATAGGITSASAAISDNVNNMHDRKKVEVVLENYEGHLQDIGKILHFVNQGLYKLRGHPFLRSGTQHYSEEWEIRRAVQMISLVDSPIMRATEITDAAIIAVQGLFEGMDKYFIKDSRELRKGCKKEVVAQIKEVANVLNDGIVELNAIREELQEATGSL